MTVRSFLFHTLTDAPGAAPICALFNSAGNPMVVTSIQFGTGATPSMIAERYETTISTQTATDSSMTFTTGDHVVTGSGTAFLSKFRAGAFVKLDADADDFYKQIASVDSDTALTLVEPYEGPGGSGTGRRRAFPLPIILCADSPGAKSGVVAYSLATATLDEPDEVVTLTGTATLTNGNTSVTGSGTAFTTELIVGSVIKLATDDDTAYAVVAAIGSNTSLTLAANYTGTGGSGDASKLVETYGQQIYNGDLNRAMTLQHPVTIPVGNAIVIETLFPIAGSVPVFVEIAFTKDV